MLTKIGHSTLQMKLLTSALLVIGLSNRAFAQDTLPTAPNEAVPQAQTFSASQTQAGLEAWARAYEVFSHPRCANCHVEDGVPMWSGPSYGETRAHGMLIGGDPDMQMGNPAATCNTCHGPQNALVPHGPPGNDVWLLAPPEMVWFSKTSPEVCAQIKDPERNGGRTVEEVADHITHDSLVLWGWKPGPGREPAPGTPEDMAAALMVWLQNGAPCPD